MTTSKVREGEGPDYGPGPTSKEDATVELPESIAQQASGVNGDANKYVANIPYLANIPQEMRKLTQWVTWKLITRNGKSTKVLYNARTGKNAKSTDESTWSTFEQASKAYDKGKYSGIGFVLTPEFGCVCIDLDHCRDVRLGEIELREQEIIDGFDTYTEISQSGTGIHIFVKAHKPGEKCRKGNVEIYDDVRYIAMTGNVLEGKPTTIENQQEALDALYLDTFGKDGTTKATAKTVIEDDLTLDPNASPPPAKLVKLRDKSKFEKTWMRERERSWTASEYDASLASFAVAAEWSNQEIADLLIAWRRRHDEDPAKALRIDYIKRTIEGARELGDSKALGGSKALTLLPFKVQKVVQRGREDADYTLVLEDGREIRIGPARVLRSFRNAGDVIYDAGYALSSTVGKKWSEITSALLGLMEVVETITDAEAVREWAQDLIHHQGLSLFDPDDPICPLTVGEALSGEYHAAHLALDKDGRIYIRLVDRVLESARERLGQAISQKTLASRISEVGFKKLPSPVRVKSAGMWTKNYKSSVLDEAKMKQVSVWMSPKGMVVQEIVDEAREVAHENAEREWERLKDSDAEISSTPRRHENIPF